MTPSDTPRPTPPARSGRQPEPLPPQRHHHSLLLLCLLGVLLVLVIALPEEDLWRAPASERLGALHALEVRIAALQERIDAQGYEWQAGITGIAHLSAAEFQALLGARPPAGEPEAPARFAVAAASATDDLPARWDWRERGAVTPARTQGECGSCWAFAAAAALESRLEIYDHRTTDLSEQQAIDCNLEDYGCGGGWMTSAYRLWRDVGAVAEGDIPYTGDDERTCSDAPLPILATVRDWETIAAGIEALKRAVRSGPVAVTMHAYADFQYYSRGVYEHEGSDPINHAVVLIGWDDGLDAWIIKNSWGTGWGEEGCAYVRYGSCRLGTYAHRISIPAANPLRFDHTALTDTLLAAPARLNATLVSGDAPLDPDAVGFWIDSGAGYTRIAPERLGGDDFQASYSHQLPALEAGATIRYWFEARDLTGNQIVHPRDGSAAPFSFRLLRLVFDDSLEVPGAWTVDPDRADPAAGAWAWGVPEAVFGPGARLIQPGVDHSLNGDFCFATGLAAGEDHEAGDLDGGATVLQSPQLDLGGLEDARLRFWLWFVNHIGDNAGEDPFIVHASDDGGANWVELWRTYDGAHQWRRIEIDLGAALALTPEVLLRFTAADLLGDSVVEALIDDLRILTGTPASTAVDEPPPDPAPGRLLLQVGPNPAHAEARVRLDLHARLAVRAAVYDASGRCIETLCDRILPPGQHEWLWAGRDRAGRPVPTGVYWIRAAAGNQSVSRRLTFIR